MLTLEELHFLKLEFFSALDLDDLRQMVQAKGQRIHPACAYGHLGMYRMYDWPPRISMFCNVSGRKEGKKEG